MPLKKVISCTDWGWCVAWPGYRDWWHWHCEFYHWPPCLHVTQCHHHMSPDGYHHTWHGAQRMQGDLVITIRTFKKRLSQLEEITFDLIGFIADIRIYFVKIILRARRPAGSCLLLSWPQSNIRAVTQCHRSCERDAWQGEGSHDNTLSHSVTPCLPNLHITQVGDGYDHMIRSLALYGPGGSELRQ